MPAPSTPDPIPGRSPRLFRLFRWYARRYIARHFHAVRVSREGPIPDLAARPAVIVANHPSWWDPLIPLVLSSTLPDDRVHYAPIEAIGLAQYPFLARLGFFGFESGTTAGAARFLRTSLAILTRPESILWITAQGQFVDPRERPTGLQPGIGHLAHRMKQADVIPLAIEYPFWNDRCPEILIRFGPAIAIESGRGRPAREWTALIEKALEDALDALADASKARDPDAFTTLIQGTAGVGGVYDRWRRLRAVLTGRAFRAEHATRPPTAGVSRPDDEPTRLPNGRNPIA